MRLSANPTVRNGIPSEDKGAIRRQGCRPQKKRLVIPSSTGGGREPPRAAGLLDQQRLRRFGDVALCARIPRSGRLGAPSSPSGCFKRTLWETFWGRSAMRPTVGHLALRPRSVRPNRPTGPHTGASSFLSEARTDKATSPKRPGGPRTGASSFTRKRAAARGCGRRPGEGRAAARGGRRPKGRGPPRAPRPEPGRGPGGKGSRPPRSARASRRPSWSPAPRPAAPAGAARSRRPARRCRSRR